MTIKLSLVLASMLLVACQSSGPNFRAMTQAQLDAHNVGLSDWDQIVCVEDDRRTGSHLRKTTCMSRRDLQMRDRGAVSGINSASIGNGVSVDAR